MKNLIIFVLTLVALSSVFSMKLNKVLKEEKILTVSKVNNEEQLDKSLKVQRKDKDDDDDDKPKRGRKIETTNENNSLQSICDEANKFVGSESAKRDILSALGCTASKTESNSEKMLKQTPTEVCDEARNFIGNPIAKNEILSALGCM